jgi:hypothetical protein
MLSYLTEIDLKKSEIRTKFCGETNTFVFDNSSRFRIEDAIKISGEFMANRIREFAAALLARAEEIETRDKAMELLGHAESEMLRLRSLGWTPSDFAHALKNLLEAQKEVEYDSNSPTDI